MLRLKAALFAIILFVGIKTIVEAATPGATCKKHSDCSSELLYCSDGVCMCNETASYTQYRFSSYETTDSVTCEQMHCHKNGKSCVAGKCVPWQGNSGDGRCLCDEGKGVTSGSGFNLCSVVNTAEVGNMCNRFSSICDIREGLYCTYSRCLCRPDHVYDFTKSRCITTEDYLKEHDMTQYIGSNGDYCKDDSDCGENLKCSLGKKCECSPGCGPYDYSKGKCMCENKTATINPTLVWSIGVIVAIAVLRLLYCFCASSSKKPTTESTSAEAAEASEPRHQETLLYNDNTFPTALTFTSLDPLPSAPTFTALDLPPSYEEVVGKPYPEHKM